MTNLKSYTLDASSYTLDENGAENPQGLKTDARIREFMAEHPEMTYSEAYKTLADLYPDEIHRLAVLDDAAHKPIRKYTREQRQEFQKEFIKHVSLFALEHKISYAESNDFILTHEPEWAEKIL
jgi:hypothetical protein